MPRPTHTRGDVRLEEPLLVGYRELEFLLGLPRRTLQRMRGRGELPEPRKIGRRKVWLLHEVRDALERLPREGLTR